MEKGDNRPLESQAWLLAPMLNGEPLKEDASLRNFNGGVGCHVASALEVALLLTIDMAELRSIRKNEVFLNLKRYLGRYDVILFSFFFFLFYFFFIPLVICYVNNSFLLGCPSHLQG